jgi:hypothetical protein
MRNVTRRLVGTLLVLVTIAAFAPSASATAGTDCAGSSGDTPFAAKYVNGSHAGKNWQFTLCLLRDHEVFFDYIYSRLKFSGTGAVNQKGVVQAIEINWLYLYEGTSTSGYRAAICDQYSGSGNGDGGGCDSGNVGSNGPCAGWRNPASHGIAQGAQGCDTSISVNFSQSDKYHDPTGDTNYYGIVQFRLKFSDNTTSSWLNRDISGTQQ